MQIQKIPIDFKKIKSVALDSIKIKVISLESKDQSLLYYINKIQFWKNKIIIYTQGKLCVFDNNGKFLFNVGNKGNGPGEYTILSNFFIQNEYLNLYDSQTKRILTFDADGRFLHSTLVNGDTNHSYPMTLFPTNHDSYYIARNTFQGNNVKTPTLSVWTKDYKFVREITKRYLTTGLSAPDEFSFYKNEILYWELLNDTIFYVQNYNKLIPKYYVDFQDKAIPANERVEKDLYKVIQYTNRPEVIEKIASRIGYIHEDDNYIRFLFMFQRKMHYVRYDKNKQLVFTYCFSGEQLNADVNYFLDVQDDNIVLSANIKDNYDKNPMLLIINDKYIQ